mgnify:CR=1 FL=1
MRGVGRVALGCRRAAVPEGDVFVIAQAYTRAHSLR